jgi:uncharacterized protein
MNTLTQTIQQFVKERFESFEGSHDWFHIERVWNTAKYIQSQEGGNLEVIELAALLHDIADHKYNDGDFQKGQKVAYELLITKGASEELAEEVSKVIGIVSFKGANVADEAASLEGQIVRDADRLDAIGAIGIARAFAYGGSRNRPLYNPEIEPRLHSSKEDYYTSKSHTINHFYEKLLLLKDRIQTPTAKILAEERQKVMLDFLEQFKKEWSIK